LFADHLEMSLYTPGIAHSGSGFIKYALGAFCLCPYAEQEHHDNGKMLLHILLFSLLSE
jgi:hypothetical protein